MIKGIQKTSMIDYPGKICTILFLGGCNFKCPYCYNKSLVLGSSKLPEIPEDEIIDFLKNRIKWIDGVCITGGEPLLYDDIDKLLLKIKEKKLLVKIDTNGTNPGLLKKLIDVKLVDYIAMDVKNSLEKYDMTSGVKVDIEKIKKTIKIIIDSDVDYEFRCTFVKKFHDKEDVEKISEILKNSKKFYIQNFKKMPEMIDDSLMGENSFSKEELEGFRRILEKNIEKVEIRN